MKFYLKLFISLVFIFAIALPLVIKGPGGKPVMSVSDWLPEGVNLNSALKSLQQSTDSINIEQLQQTAKDAASQATASLQGDNTSTADQAILATNNDPIKLSSNSGKMYKWQDENGRWHFSSEKPMDTANVHIENLPDVENVMQAPKIEDQSGGGISLPGMAGMGGNANELLEKMQKMAAEREQ